METPLKKKPHETTIDTSQFHQNKSKWPHLPKDLLLQIIKHLDIITDVTRIRSVCPAWRSALPLSEFPMREIHLQVPGLDYKWTHNSPLFLLKTRLYLFIPSGSGPSLESGHNGPWIAKVGELHFKKWRLLSPFSGLTYSGRYWYTDPHITGQINLLDCRIIELGRPMYLVPKLDYYTEPISEKVVVGEGAVLVLLKKHFGGGLVLWKLGDKKWTKIQCIEKGLALTWVRDIAFHNGNFYAFQWDTSERGILVLNSEGQFISYCDFTRKGRTSFLLSTASLVPSQSNGSLYLVLLGTSKHNPTSTKHFVNKKVINKVNEWELVKHLGDITLVLGVDNVSFALYSSILKLLKWEPNSIYSHSKYFISYEGPNIISLKSKGLRWLKNLDCEACYKSFEIFSMDAKKKGICKKRGEGSKLFFPPPACVKWRCPSLGNIEVSFHRL